MIFTGLWVQAAALIWISFQDGLTAFAAGAVLHGAGTAMAYPVLLALVSDRAEPAWRGSALGVYRLWRDSGYAVGAVTTGIVADAFGIRASIMVVVGLALISGAVVAIRMGRRTETS